MTEKASLTTISIALMLADEAMRHKPLIISGSPEFRKKVPETAVPPKFTNGGGFFRRSFRRQKNKKGLSLTIAKENLKGALPERKGKSRLRR